MRRTQWPQKHQAVCHTNIYLLQEAHARTFCQIQAASFKEQNTITCVKLCVCVFTYLKDSVVCLNSRNQTSSEGEWNLSDLSNEISVKSLKHFLIQLNVSKTLTGCSSPIVPLKARYMNKCVFFYGHERTITHCIRCWIVSVRSVCQNVGLVCLKQCLICLKDDWWERSKAFWTQSTCDVSQCLSHYKWCVTVLS